MKAWVIDGQFGLDNLKLIERPRPEPRFGEVVIRTRAVSLNYRDTQMVAGTYPFKFPLPLVPASDGVGEVVVVGEGVTRARPGDRVLGTFWQSWLGGDFDQTEDYRAARRRPRRDAVGICAARPARSRACARASQRRRGFNASLRSAHRLAGACHRGAPQSRRDGPRAGHRGRVDLRASVRRHVRRDDDRHLLERRQARARAQARRDACDQLRRRPPCGIRKSGASTAAGGSIMWWRSEAPTASCSR